MPLNQLKYFLNHFKLLSRVQITEKDNGRFVRMTRTPRGLSLKESVAKETQIIYFGFAMTPPPSSSSSYVFIFLLSSLLLGSPLLRYFMLSHIY